MLGIVGLGAFMLGMDIVIRRFFGMAEPMQVPDGLDRHQDRLVPGRMARLQTPHHGIGEFGMGVAPFLGHAV